MTHRAAAPDVPSGAGGDGCDMQGTRSDVGPPQPPAIDRRLQFARLQLVGMPLMMLVPLLAVFGLLGEARERTERAGDGVRVRVDYPGRARFEADTRLRLSVENVGSAALSDTRVEFERGLMDALSGIGFSPPVERIDRQAYVVGLGELAPGAERVVFLDFRPSERGRLGGRVTLRAAGAPLVEVPIEVLVFP